METSEIRLIWTGKTWDMTTSGPTPGCEPGTEFLLRVPTAAFISPPSYSATTQGTATALLFPAGTFLYLPVNPVKNEDKAWTLWIAHRDSHQPALAKTPQKPMIPILLEDELRFANATSRGLGGCRCRIGDRAFDSVNQAASYALLEWSGGEAGTINVFDGVRFIHDKMLVRLRDQRSHLLDGDPLPANPDLDEGTPELFPA